MIFAVSDTVWSNLITAAAGLLLAALNGWIGLEMLRIKSQVNTVAKDVLRVEKATNSHTDLLVAATAAAAHGAGKEEERAEERARTAEARIAAADEKPGS